jgi:DNA-binding CsgD family transcriptional regulator
MKRRQASSRGDAHPPTPESASAPRSLERGRELYARRAWTEAYEALEAADRESPLAGPDLFLLAKAAALIGRDEDYLSALQRAYRVHVEAGELQRAALVAFWLVLRLRHLGEHGRASGWLGRAQRLLERDGRDCVERGYLLLLEARRPLASGDCTAACAIVMEAAAIGERFGDKDLTAFARSVQGQATLRAGRVKDGLALLDEAMVAVTTGEVSPLPTGFIYCSVLQSCRQVYALSRCREWTKALAAWCEQQPGVTFTGVCLVHRSEVLQLNGSWRDAIDEARRATERLSRDADPAAVGDAFYQQAELHRLRGEFAAAERAYKRANECGREPQPGLALMRLAEGRSAAAAAQIRRVVGTAGDRFARIRLLPACVEILLAVGETEEAAAVCRELEETAATFDTEVLNAIAAHARGALDLASGDARTALAPLRSSLEIWQRVGAPYLAARVRVLVGLACRALGDSEAAHLEVDAARAVFEKLGAATDLARTEPYAERATTRPPHGITPRELQVLRLVAAGKTNRAIAAALGLSEKTVDRHVSNIFIKLDVPSRAAATAFAYEHKLV